MYTFILENDEENQPDLHKYIVIKFHCRVISKKPNKMKRKIANK